MWWIRAVLFKGYRRAGTNLDLTLTYVRNWVLTKVVMKHTHVITTTTNAYHDSRKVTSSLIYRKNAENLKSMEKVPRTFAVSIVTTNSKSTCFYPRN